jgi:hypothetical protein
MVSISQQQSSPVISYSKGNRKKCDITSLLGQMCPPAATSASFGKLRPIVSSHAWRVVGTCELPVAVIGRAYLVMVDSASGLDRGCGLRVREGTGQRQWQWWWRGQLRGEGAFSSFGSLAVYTNLVVRG